MPATVMAATRWPTNAHLVADVAALGYLDRTVRTLDLTFGRGTWWNEWRPDDLVANGTEPGYPNDLTADFRRMPFRDGAFAQIAYDPPYVVKGGRRTSTMEDHQERYGLVTAPSSPAGGQALMDAGLLELRRLLAPGGVGLVKCQNYVASGRVQWGADDTTAAIRELGGRKLDEFVFLNNGSAQDKSRTKKCPVCAPGSKAWCATCRGERRVPVTQQHARRNYSYLWVVAFS